MKTLRFKAEDVRRVAEHSIAARTQMRSARQVDAGAVIPAVVLACDHGVYLMSNGEPRDLIEGQRSFAAYAVGCDPFRDADWRAHTSELIGGDDFSLTLSWATDLKSLVDAGLKTITVRVGRKGDRIEAEIGSDA